MNQKNKSFSCDECGRPISHFGNCLACNIKKSKEANEKIGVNYNTNDKMTANKDIRIAEEKKFIFPFPSMRASQKEMISDVRSAVESKRHLIADAPTGLGKTIAALFPAVEYAVNNGKTVFFLTSRLSQHKAAVETLKMMKLAQTQTPAQDDHKLDAEGVIHHSSSNLASYSLGNEFSAVDIIGKKHLCSHDVKDMDSSMFSNFCSAMIKEKKCAYYKNFYRRDLDIERNGIINIISSRGPMSTEEAMNLVSGRYCTYEMLMETAKKADVIIGDYFHLFGMGDKFLKRMGKGMEDIIIIVDEAHNIAARLRSHMSFRLSTRTCELAAKEAASFAENEARDYAKDIGKTLQGIGKKHLFNAQESLVSREELTDKIAGYDKITAKMAGISENILEERKVSFIGRVASFLDSWKKDDIGYARIISRERIRGQDHIALQFNCLDPSLISKGIIQQSHSAILMSGTLSPMEMHRDLLGMEAPRTAMKSYISPFPKHNRKNIIATGITTKYKERTADNFARIANKILLCVHAIKGNAAVFFPSYEIRNNILDIISPAVRKRIILEDNKMTKDERDRIKNEMEKHSKPNQHGAVLFGVLGGSFSEGIDLPGDLLNGVVIVGLPLERPNLSIKVLIDYYDKRFQRGINYGYIYPAMIKVMQASGRCIRSESDRGVIVFADERFTWENYRRIFPKTWDFVVTERPEIEIQKFFGDSKQADLKDF